MYSFVGVSTDEESGESDTEGGKENTQSRVSRTVQLVQTLCTATLLILRGCFARVFLLAEEASEEKEYQ